MPPRRAGRVGALGRGGGRRGGRRGHGRDGRDNQVEDRVSEHGEAEVNQQGNVNVENARGAIAREVVEALAAANLLHPPPTQASGNSRALEAMREFRRGNPPTFSGTSGDFLEADHWLSDIKQLLDALFIVEDDLRVRIVGLQLVGEAGKWWQSILAGRKDARRMERVRNGTNEPDVEHMTWLEFEAFFEDQFFPPSFRDSLRSQFERLEQGSMSVTEYAIQFQSLSRFAPELVALEERKCRRFEGGLKTSIKRLVVSQRIKSFSEIVECARTVESIEEEEPVKKVWEPRRQAPSVTTESEAPSGSSRKRPRESVQASHGQPSTGQSVAPKAAGTRQHIVCHKCGVPGHFRSQCTEVQSTLHTQRKCYACGKQGHIARNCPSGVSESGSVQQPGGGQGFGQQVVNPGHGYYKQATSAQGSTPTQGGGQASGQLTHGRVYNILTAANLPTSQAPGTSSTKGILFFSNS